MIDKALHLIYESHTKIKWIECEEDSDFWYYYAENRLYVFYEHTQMTYGFAKGKNPKDAYRNYMNDRYGGWE